MYDKINSKFIKWKTKIKDGLVCDVLKKIYCSLNVLFLLPNLPKKSLTILVKQVTKNKSYDSINSYSYIQKKKVLNEDYIC